MSYTQEEIDRYANEVLNVATPYKYSIDIERILDSHWGDETVRTAVNDVAWGEFRRRIREIVDKRFTIPQSRQQITYHAFMLIDSEAYESHVYYSGENVTCVIWNNEKEIRFLCPSCERFSKLESIQTEVNVTAIVNLIDEQTGYFEIDESTIEIGGTPGETRFQCGVCGHVVAESEDDLASWYMGVIR